MSVSVKTITACAACAAAIGLGAYTLFLNKDRNSVPTYTSVVTELPGPTEPQYDIPDNWADQYDARSAETGMTERAKSLLRLNKDIAGWIKIDNTMVNYPVVKDPGEIPADDPYYGPESYYPNAYYLNHDLDKSIIRQGTLYMDYRNVFGSNEEEQSDNIVIYGHNMANNTMFGGIRRYRQDFDFYEVSPFVEFSSNYRDYEYVIFAFLITSGSYNDTDFHYWNMEDLSNKKDFDFYIDNCKSRQMIDTGVDVKYGDKLLTLSTCYADEDNSRFLVVARRLREGEVAGDMSTIQRTEEYIKAQKEKEEEKKAAENETA